MKRFALVFISSVCLNCLLLLINPCHADTEEEQNAQGLRDFARETAIRAPSRANPPSGGVLVSDETVRSILVGPVNLSTSRIQFRITSGALKGSIAQGRFARDSLVFIEITSIQTPAGRKVWMPMCHGVDMHGVVDIPRVQVDRDQWKQVINGGTFETGTAVDLRLLGPVQFDIADGGSPSSVTGMTYRSKGGE